MKSGVTNYGISYEFTEEQRKTLDGVISGKLSFRQAKKELDVSTSGVYTMICNYAKQLYKEGKIK